jgi:hypothetical protein
MQDCPHPRTLKSLCVLLGLTRYFNNFVKKYGKIVGSLTFLLKNNSFVWSEAIGHAFSSLKYFVCMTPILAMIYFTKTFVLECDSSGRGLGMVRS